MGLTRRGLSFRGGSARLKEMPSWGSLHDGLIAERPRGAEAPLFFFFPPSPPRGRGIKKGDGVSL